MTTAWDKLTPNQMAVRATHIQKFRAAMTAELTRRGLAARATYTDDAATIEGKPVKAIHIQELMDKLQNIKTTTYSDEPIKPNQTVVKSEHFDQIGAMINLLEAAPKVGGVTTCNAGCTGLCVSCSGTCTGGCTSCNGCAGGCTGCGGCSYTCTSCVGCSGTCTSCTGCGDGCTSGCHAGCSDGCKGNCGNGCANTCTVGCSNVCVGCSGNCVSTNYLH